MKLHTTRWPGFRSLAVGLSLVVAGCGGGGDKPNPVEPQPVALAITSFTPAAAKHGTSITITGTGFATTLAGNTVTINNIAATVTAATATQLTVTVPKNKAASGAIKVTTGSVNVTSATPFTYRWTAIVTTLAGNGVALLGDGTGVGARFNDPQGVTTDPDGNVYVADGGNHAIRIITPGGEVTTLAGNGTAGYVNGAGTAARFSFPSALVWSGGTLYISDRDNHVIRNRSGTTGSVFTALGPLPGTAGNPWGFTNGLPRDVRFNAPAGLTLGNDGNLYIADRLNHAIRKIDLTVSTGSSIVTTATGNGTLGHVNPTPFFAADARLNEPTGIVASGSETNLTLIFAERGNHDIRLRRFQTIGGSTIVNSLSDYSGSDTPGYIDGPRLSARYNQPEGIARDEDGNLYIADRFNHAIRVLMSATDEVITLAGGNGLGFADDAAGAGIAKFDQPVGIALGPNGELYVADSGNHRIRKIVIE